MSTTELSGDFERKRHEEMLKLECLKLAAGARSPSLFTDGVPIEDILSQGKLFFHSITREHWGSEPLDELRREQ